MTVDEARTLLLDLIDMVPSAILRRRLWDAALAYADERVTDAVRQVATTLVPSREAAAAKS